MSEHTAESYEEAVDYAFDMGWTDGLPVVPPTMERVERMLAAARSDQDEVVGRVTARHRVITAGQVAANAVMAGCTDGLFPVVLAAVRGLLSDAFNIVGPSASTGGAAPLVLIHGPVVSRLGYNSGTAVLGAGNRANMTTGRAVNLVIRNAVGSVPGDLDRATTGHPGRITYCLPEGETGPWDTLGGDLGVGTGRSAVSVFAAEAPHSVAEHASEDPERLLHAFARIIRATNYSGAAMVVVVCPEHRDVFQRAGWSRGTIRDHLFDATMATGNDLRHTGRHTAMGGEVELPVVPSPNGIWIVSAGGSAGGHSAVIPPWLGSGRGEGSRPVTIPIEE